MSNSMFLEEIWNEENKFPGQLVVGGFLEFLFVCFESFLILIKSDVLLLECPVFNENSFLSFKAGIQFYSFFITKSPFCLVTTFLYFSLCRKIIPKLLFWKKRGRAKKIFLKTANKKRGMTKITIFWACGRDAFRLSLCKPRSVKKSPAGYTLCARFWKGNNFSFLDQLFWMIFLFLW